MQSSRAGGFTAAQSALNAGLSQMSVQIGELESRLGMRLCHVAAWVFG